MLIPLRVKLKFLSMPLQRLLTITGLGVKMFVPLAGVLSGLALLMLMC